MIAGLRLARQNQVNVRVRPTEVAIDESVDLAHEIVNRVFSEDVSAVGGAVRIAKMRRS